MPGSGGAWGGGKHPFGGKFPGDRGPCSFILEEFMTQAQENHLRPSIQPTCTALIVTQSRSAHPHRPRRLARNAFAPRL